MAELYRKSSIEKLSNPEQLDRTIKITSPMSWLALLGVTAIIIVTLIWSVIGTLPTIKTVNGVVVNKESVAAYYADCSGTVIKLLKKSGEYIKKGDGIITAKLNDGKEYTITAVESGTLGDYLVEVDSKIYAGAELARYTPDISQSQVVVCYVPVSVAKQLKENMEVLLYLSSVDSQKYGHMEAEIDSIGEYAAAMSNMWYVLGTDNLMADLFLSEGPVSSVVCRIKKDEGTDSGFYWSSSNGKNVTVSNGSFVSAKIVVDECAPIEKLFNSIKDKLED